MQLSGIVRWVDAVNQEVYPERMPENTEQPSPELVSEELCDDHTSVSSVTQPGEEPMEVTNPFIAEVSAVAVHAIEPSPLELAPREPRTNRTSSVTQRGEESMEIAKPFIAEIPARAITPVDPPPPAPLQGHHGYVVRDTTHAILRIHSLFMIVAVGLASLLIPAVRDPAFDASLKAICTSPLRTSFTFCRGPQDVVVMHDFSALAQIHSMTLATLYDTAIGVWTLSEELAHQGRSAKQLAYYAKDSSLSVRETLSHDLHLLNENAKTSASSLNRLGATTVGTVMRTGASFERIYRIVHSVQISMDDSPLPSLDVDDIAIKFEQTFLLAVAELKEDLEALQNATSFTLGDLFVLEEQVDAIDAVARREDRALETSIEHMERKAARSLLWARARAETALDGLLDDALLVRKIRDNCEDARQAVTASAKAVAQMLAEMEYLGGLPTTRLLMDGVALPQLEEDLKACSVGIEATLDKFEGARAQERAKRWAVVDARNGDP
ncbi:uncharacterized protein PHACADRAFT_165718 [Phanerochaete carnosa HHB-10118-sp]|uniref:Uncharacterized protein n=1 Tax=Phanerochaete carnosa (strain HHB-10118-sp) TaxID=650164 RepID=K5VIJ2_PHACS|nr:uncharacterized protein PHACADRAFT_165718 [Phanerochaete carnosa HHB-10118-sp]EKM51098.1 hypothetical protein PHACADRAFT_165718 [Phanerochaete carnosa HHB-10118-sp]